MGQPPTYTGRSHASEGPSSEAGVVWAPRAYTPHHTDAKKATDTAACAKSLPTMLVRHHERWRTGKSGVSWGVWSTSQGEHVAMKYG